MAARLVGRHSTDKNVWQQSLKIEPVLVAGFFMRGRMAGMTERPSTWRKASAQIFAIWAILAFFSGLVDINYPLKHRSPNVLFHLTPPVVFGVLAIAFYYWHRVYLRKP